MEIVAGAEFESAHQIFVVTRYTEDRERLLEMFPQEIWLLVLNCLEDSEDLTSVANASPVFREMLEGRKVEYLFAAIWNILGGRLHEEERTHWRNLTAISRNRDNVVDPNDYMIDYKRWFSGILSLRLVSNSWKKALDHFYFIQALPTAFARNDLYRGQKAAVLQTKYFWKYDLLTWGINTPVQLVVNFLEHFERTHGNGRAESSPFLGKYVYIWVPDGEDDVAGNYERALSQIFQNYGHHIRICEIRIEITTVAPDMIATLRQWISLLPNLNSLYLDFTKNFDIEDVYAVQWDFVRAMQPLPKLKKLEYLRLNNYVAVVANLFLEAYSHVSILHLAPREQCAFINVLSQPFPNLKDLTVYFDTMSEFEKLEAAQFSSSFRNLDITFVDTEIPPLARIFALLARKWATSLKRLEITVIISLFHSNRVDEDYTENQIRSLKRQLFPGLEEWNNEVD